MTCKNCGRNTNNDRLRTGRCMSCYRYWRKHGEDRTEIHRSPKEPVPICSNCKENLAPSYSGLCGACYQYQKLHGRSRPRYLWSMKCKVCGRPRQAKGEGYVKNRCPTCYDYWRKHNGVDRSVELVIGIAPLGWCDCGRPAVEMQRLAYGNRREEFSVCAEHKE